MKANTASYARIGWSKSWLIWIVILDIAACSFHKGCHQRVDSLDAGRDYGMSFMKEAQRLTGRPYYAPRQLQEVKRQD
jgi:hypothetical protein